MPERLVEEIQEIREIQDAAERQTRLRVAYTRACVPYYKNGQPVQWAVRMVEQAIRYQEALWKRCGMVIYPVSGSSYFRVTDHGCRSNILKAKNIAEALRQGNMRYFTLKFSV